MLKLVGAFTSCWTFLAIFVSLAVGCSPDNRPITLVVTATFPAITPPVAPPATLTLASKPSNTPTPNAPPSPTPSVTQPLNPPKGKIAFSNAGRIYIINADGSGLMQVTTIRARYSEPVLWSLDGSLVYFLSDMDNPGTLNLFRAAADGRTLTRLNPIGVYDAGLSLSSDNRHVTFISEGQDQGQPFQNVFVLTSQGTGLKRLPTKPGLPAWFPSWSPDGSKIAYFLDHDRDNNVDLWVMSANGTNQTQLTHSFAVAGEAPSWSPDSSRLTIALRRDPAKPLSDIYAVSADGSQITQLTDGFGFAYSPVWSPDGAKIVFQSDYGSDTRNFFIMNADGSGLRRLTDEPKTANALYHSVIWSPDGKYLAFTAQRALDGNSMDIFVIDSDGNGETQLTSNLGSYLGGLAWFQE